MKTNLGKLAVLVVGLLLAFSGGAQPVTKIAGGQSHSLFLKSDGSLSAMGYNYFGQLGDGNYDTASPYGTNQPQQLVTSNITAITAGGGHSLFLKSDGSLWAMGDNRYGQLGDGIFISSAPYGVNVPEQIVANGITNIAAGGAYNLILKSDGSLWAMGANNYGQLGDGTFIPTFPYGVNLPEQIVANGVTNIAAGGSHSLFVKSDGGLWAMGWNKYGQLGDGTTNNINNPKWIVTNGVKAIAAGQDHSLFIKSDGSLWAMGYNSVGQLGDGTHISPYIVNHPEQIVASNVTAIAAGRFHSLFIKSDGSLWAMGDNQYGQLGDGTYNSINHPEQIVTNGVTAIAAGGGHSLFIKSDGSLWVMGENNDGQLGDGTYFNTNRPKLIVVNSGYNRITGQLLSGGGFRLSYVGMANANYALDRAFNLSPLNWIPQATNPANSFGALIFTNTPVAATNNFWRIRSVP